MANSLSSLRSGNDFYYVLGKGGIPAHYCFLCDKPYLFWDVYFKAERALKTEFVTINVGSRYDPDTLQNPKYYKYDWIEQQEELDMRRYMDGC